MRITNELRSYVTDKVSKLIPEPNSVEAYNEVHEAAARLIKDFEEYMDAQANAYIKKAQGLEIFEGCDISRVFYGRHAISVGTSKAPAVMQYNNELAECVKFRETVTQKAFALLSIQKEVEDLDKFIENVVASIR